MKQASIYRSSNSLNKALTFLWSEPQEQIQVMVWITMFMTWSIFNFLVQSDSRRMRPRTDFSSVSLQSPDTLDWSFVTSYSTPTSAVLPSVLTLTNCDQSILNFLRLSSTQTNKSFPDVVPVMGTMSKSSSVTSKVSSTPWINTAHWGVLSPSALSWAAVEKATNDLALLQLVL